MQEAESGVETEEVNRITDHSQQSDSPCANEGAHWTGADHPKPKPLPHYDELLHSIGLEEIAIARMIDAEAEKAQAVAHLPVTPMTPDELIAFQYSIAKVLQTVVDKEALLLKKLRVLLYAGRCHDGCKCHTQCP